MTNTARLQIPELSASENVANGPTRINEGWTKIDNTDLGYEDFLQAGVVRSTDWSFTANIVGGTGTLGSTASVGGIAWLSDPVLSGGLMRTVTIPATLSGLVPPSKPATGKFMTIGFELTPATWNGSAEVSLVSGIEKSTEAEAKAAPPPVTSGKIRIRDVVVHNTSGTYSIVVQYDRRTACEACFRPGDLKATADSTAPFGWFLCNGEEIRRTQYPALFEAIGTTFGAGDGSTTFNLPKASGRTMIGSGEATGAAGATNHALGTTGGEEKHTLTAEEIPSHSHEAPSGKSFVTRARAEGEEINGALGTATGLIPKPLTETAATQNKGGGASHNHLQPFFTGNWLIRY